MGIVLSATIGCNSMTGKWYLMPRQPDQGELGSPEPQEGLKYYELELNSDGTALGKVTLEQDPCLRLNWHLDRKHLKLRRKSGTDWDRSIDKKSLDDKSYTIEFACGPNRIGNKRLMSLMVCPDNENDSRRKCKIVTENPRGFGVIGYAVWLSRNKSSLESLGATRADIAYGVSGLKINRGTTTSYEFCADGTFREELHELDSAGLYVTRFTAWEYLGTWKQDGDRVILERRQRKKWSRRSMETVSEIMNIDLHEAVNVESFEVIGSAKDCSNFLPVY